MPRNALIQVRRDTAANWTSTNPTLASGEIGFETDTGRYKIGNGTTPWNSLSIDLTVDTLVVDSVSATNQVEGDVLISYAGTSVGTDLSVGNDLEVVNNVTISGTSLTIGSGTVIADSLYAQTSIQLSGDDVALNRSLPIKTAANVNVSSGTWWRSPYIPYPSTAVNSTFSLGVGVSVPFVFDTRVTISEIGFLSAPSVASSTTAKIAIYQTGATDNVPQARVYESSNLAVSGTNQQISLTGIEVILDPGIYWFFVFNSGAGTLALNMIATNLMGTVYAVTPYASMSAALTQANTNGGWGCTFGGASSTSILVPFGSGPTGTSPGQNWPRMAIRRSE